MRHIKDRGVKRGERKKTGKSSEKKYFNEFKNFILESDHPCLMAQAVFKTSSATVKVYDKFDQLESTYKLKQDLDHFAQRFGEDSDDFNSFVAVFPDFRIYNEIDFEKLLWKRLQLIHDVDTHPWDSAVSSDPNDCNFSFSIAGKAFYVIGMHPESSRIARQAPQPTMVFNLHNQFEKLRKNGVYQEVRNKVRQRDYMVQGSLNPMIADFGETSEARQYSGRKVADTWECPFEVR